MKVDLGLSKAFDAEFERLITSFAFDQGLLPEESAMASKRFVARSIVSWRIASASAHLR